MEDLFVLWLVPSFCTNCYTIKPWFSGGSEEKHSPWLWSVSHQIQLQDMSDLKLFQVCHNASGKGLVFSSALYNSLCNTRKCRFQEINLFEKEEKQHIPLAFLSFTLPGCIYLLFFLFFITVFATSGLKQYSTWQRQLNKLPSPIFD